ncbi:MAG: DUF6796 family protein [Lachnospiraceae bacterium]|jgi:multisubunit Na+/H+ antiporter MnhG subunit
MEGENKLKKDIDWDRISLLLKISILGAFINLAGDMLAGWGVRNTSLNGIEGLIYQYITMSDRKMFWAAILGLIGAPVSVLGHFGIYKLLKPYSRKYANLFGAGMLVCLILGGPGVHMSSLASAFFYKYMTAAAPATALASSIKFACYFSLPLYIPFFIFWVIDVYAYIKAVSGGFSPFPRWGWVFSIPVGGLLFSLVGLFGNYSIVNAIVMGALTLGNIWMLSGALLMLGKAKENLNKSPSD